MRGLRLLIIVALIAVAALPALAAAPQMLMCLGSYALTANTEWDKIDNDGRYFSFISLLVEKPADLAVELSEAEAKAAIYGYVELGTEKQRVLMAMGRIDSQCVSFFYVDVNNDNRLAADERVEVKKNSPYENDGYHIQSSEPLKAVICNVGYADKSGTSFTHPVAVEFRFVRRKASDGKSNEELSFYYLVDTWFSGTGRFIQGKEEKEYAFGLFDGDDDGIYNDFGRDFMMIDVNGDGQFDMEKEVYAFVELDQVKIDSKTTAQRRKALLPWPSVLLVQPSMAAVELSEPVKVEPASAEPANAEPAQAEPANAEPAQAEPAKAE